jgi:hypothetical protein
MTPADPEQTSVTVENGRLVIGGETQVRVWLHDPDGEPQPLPDGEEIKIEHPADALIEGAANGIYSPEGRPEDRPCVTVQLEGYDGE